MVRGCWTAPATSGRLGYEREGRSADDLLMVLDHAPGERHDYVVVC